MAISTMKLSLKIICGIYKKATEIANQKSVRNVSSVLMGNIHWYLRVILSIVAVRPQLFLPSYFSKLITDIQMKHSFLPFTQIQMDILFLNFPECISRKKRITTSCMHFLNYRITLALLRNSVYHYESKGQETWEQVNSWV